MSGRTGTNVVPMPTTTPPPAPSQLPFPWPNMWAGGAMPAGCCPPGGMDALMQCYCDIQAATAFISKVVTDLAANDPAFQQALVDGIAASGSNLPLIGVTNGADAQPGQVGEYVRMQQGISYTTAPQTQAVTLGVLQPGDWDIWAWLTDFTTSVTSAQFILTPQPPGFVDPMNSVTWTGGASEIMTLVSVTTRALISVPSLINFQVGTNTVTAGPGAGTAFMVFQARRRR